MKAVLLAAIVALALSSPASQAPQLRLLFIGNSLTATNDLPAMVTRIGAAGGVTIMTVTIAVGGFSLDDHWQRGDALRAIERRGWDVVILQQGPSSLPESRTELRASVRRFDAAIRRAGAKIALYMVWPSKARFADFDRASESYRVAAKDVDGILLPAGEAWRAAWRRDATLPLYGDDQFHPSSLGTWLAALTVAQGVTGRSAPVLAAALPGRTIDRSLAALLKDAVADAFAVKTP